MSTEHRAPLLDASVRVDHLPPEGRDIDVLATSEQREAIAARLGISAVERLSASLSVSGFRGGLRAQGRLEALTVQPCVVTLEPVPQEMSEPVERIFLPATERPAVSGAHPETFVDLEGDDITDYFDGHEVDLSDAIIETVALALEPYPRAPGAELAAGELPADDSGGSPFAALKSLLDPDDKP